MKSAAAGVPSPSAAALGDDGSSGLAASRGGCPPGGVGVDAPVRVRATEDSGASSLAALVGVELTVGSRAVSMGASAAGSVATGSGAISGTVAAGVVATASGAAVAASAVGPPAAGSHGVLSLTTSSLQNRF